MAAIDHTKHGIAVASIQVIGWCLSGRCTCPGLYFSFLANIKVPRTPRLNMHTTISIYHQLGIWIETVDAAYAIAALHHLIHHHPPHTYTSPPWLCSLSCPAPGRVSWRVCVGDLWCIRCVYLFCGGVSVLLASLMHVPLVTGP